MTPLLGSLSGLIDDPSSVGIPYLLPQTEEAENRQYPTPPSLQHCRLEPASFVPPFVRDWNGSNLSFDYSPSTTNDLSLCWVLYPNQLMTCPPVDFHRQKGLKLGDIQLPLRFSTCLLEPVRLCPGLEGFHQCLRLLSDPQQMTCPPVGIHRGKGRCLAPRWCRDTALI